MKRDGERFIRLDRPADAEVLKPFVDHEWNLVEHNAPFTRVEVVRTIAYVADQALLRLLGHFDASSKKWIDMSPVQRGKWIEHGPQKNVARKRLYNAVMVALEGMY